MVGGLEHPKLTPHLDELRVQLRLKEVRPEGALGMLVLVLVVRSGANLDLVERDGETHHQAAAVVLRQTSWNK